MLRVPTSRIRSLVAAALLVAAVTDAANAQVVRNFTSRYSRTDRGSFVAIGNTLMTCPDATSTCAAARAGTGSINNNQDFTMVNVDVDTAEAGANSSSATLTLPAGSTVQFAGLYWGATSSSAARNIAKLRTPASASYTTLTATQIDVSGTAYHAFADVTSLVAAAGNGVYTVADVKAVTGANAYAGWGLFVVYSDPADTPRNVTVFDGFAIVASGGGTISIPVSGFVTPPSGTVSTRISDLAYEGDLGSPGNSVRLNSIALTNAVNPANNYFNSTISLLGAHVTAKTPNYVNQLGFDLDTTDASGVLLNSATSATAQFAPGSDNYFPGVLVFATDIYQPVLLPSFTKTVTDVNGGLVTPGDVLEYTVSVANTGNDAADNVVLTDAIPANTTYVAGSLSIVTGTNAGAKTDAAGDDVANYDSGNNRVVFRLGTGATASAGGSLAAGSSTSIRFRVQIGAATANGTTISNSASIAYNERQLGTAYTITSPTASTTISLPDLTIAKSHSGSFVRGSTGTYSVVVTNSGLGATSGTVTASDTLPSGLTPTTASGTGWSCSIASQTVACTRSDALAAGSSYPAISIVANVSQSAAASLTNTATTSGGSETNTANNSSSDPTTVTSSADLSITKTGTASTFAGGTAVYTVTVTNNGSSDATGVSVADPTPSGLTFQSNTGACTTAYPCTIGALAAGASATITTTYSVPLSYATPATISNTATVSATTTDPTPSNNSATATTSVVASTDLSISKTGAASITAGNSIVYTVAVTNNGGTAATSVSVADPTPGGLTFVSNTGACTTAYPCSLGTLAAGATATITSTYAVPSSYTTPSPIVNTATVSTAILDSVAGNNSSSVSTSVTTSADVAITKTGPAAAIPGQNVVYTVVVTNNGSSDAAAVSVADPTPAGLTFVSNTGACTTAYPCSLGTVAAGATRTITTTYSVPSSYTSPDPVVNTATVSTTTTDPTSSNNSATSSTPVTPSTDLAISKTGPASINAGSSIVYTVAVTNNGGLTAAAVSVADPTPSGLTFVSNTGACTTAYPCSLGSVAPGATATITTTYAVPSDYVSPDPIVNTATVSSTTTDSVAGNNSSTASTVLTTSADVGITKTGPAQIVAGENAVYTVVVTNDGPSDATSVSVADATPAGLTFVSNSGACSTPYPCSLGTIAAGGSRTITTTYAVPASYASSGGADPVVNTATVSTATSDPNGANNSSTSSIALTTSADLAISKSGPATVTAGTNLVYTIVVTNGGSSDAASVAVADPTPAGLSFVSNTGACTTAFPCSLGTLAPGATRTITATYTVPASYTAPDPIVNTATVSSPTNDPVGANDSSTTSTNVAVSADLSITKSGPASVTAGQNVVYTVTVANDGTSDAAAVSVADTTPPGLGFVSNTGSCTTAYPCALGTIPAGQSRTITTTYSVPASYVSSGGADPIENTAVVSSTTPDPDSSDNSSTASTAVAASADLAIDKSGPASVVAGNDVVYTITVTNDGVSDAANVSVADPTPAGLTFVSNTGDCVSAYPCSLGTLAPGATRTITTTYRVPAAYTTPATIVNTATVSSTTADPSGANNSSTANTSVATSADLAITKLGPAAVIAGDELVYTVIVTNNGVSDAAAVSVSDTTPTGLTFVSNTGACTTAYPCSLGTLTPGQTKTITSTYQVPFGYTSPDPIVNTASVSSSTTDPSAANDSSTTSTDLTILEADLSITKTGPASAVPGTNVVYTVVVTNSGPDSSALTTVTDPTPSGLAFVSNTGACTTAYPCSLGTLAPGATRTITSTYSVPASYTSPDPIVNVAFVTSGNAGDPDGSDNTATSSTPVVASADLAILKSGPATIVAGSAIDYTVEVTNTGPSAAQAVTIADVTPAGLTFVSNDGGCAAGYPCSLGQIAAGETRTITSRYLVSPSYAAPGPIENTATVSASTNDPDGADNSSLASTTVTTSADLAITKSGPATVTPGENVVYTVTVTNGGSSDAAAVTVADTTPAGLTFVSNTGACTTAYPCSLGTIAAGATRTITSTYAVPSSYTAPDPIVNAATVSSATTDPNAANDTAQASSAVTPIADVSITKTGPAAATPGENVVYTVVVTNGGSSDAAAVSVADATPVGLAFVSNTGACTTAYPCSLGTVAAGGTRTITTTYSVPSSYTTPDPIVNIASIATSTADSNAANDSSTATTPVSASADLVVAKTGPASVVAGNDVVYTVTVTNDGSSDAAAVVVADPTPAGLVFVSNTGDCSSAYPCSLGTLPAGASRTITSTYTVPSSYAGANPITNTATASSTTTDATPSDNTDSALTSVTRSANLRITKTDATDPIETGANQVYTVTVANLGPSDATGVSVSDVLDPATTHVSNTGGCVHASGTLTCSVGALASGAQRSFTVTVAVSDDAPVDGTLATGPCDGSEDICNTASVSGAEPDPDASNNTATQPTDVEPLSVEGLTLAIADVSDAVLAGDRLTYVLTYSNAGTQRIDNVKLTLTYDGRTTFVSAAPAPGTGNDEWVIGSLEPGAVGRIVVEVDADGGVFDGDTLVAHAELSGTHAIVAAADEETAVREDAPDHAALVVTKDASPDSVPSGGLFTYTITARNLGPATSYATALSDTLPAGLAYLNASPAPDAIVGNALAWDLGDLASGDVRTIVVYAGADESLPAGTLLENNAYADGTPGAGTSESAGLHAEGSDVSSVSGFAGDCSLVARLRSLGIAQPGGEFVYRLLWIDPCDDAPQATIVQNLPPEMEFVSLSSNDVESYSVVTDGDHQQVVLDVGTVARGRTAIAFVRGRIADDVAPGTVLTSDAGLSDAAGRSVGSADASTVHDPAEVLDTRSFLRVTGPVRILTEAKRTYVVRYRDVPPGSSLQVNISGNFLPVSVRPDPTGAPTPPDGASRSFTFANLEPRGVIRFRGIAALDGPAEANSAISIDAVLSGPGGTEIVKSGRDISVLGRLLRDQSPSLTKGKAVLKTQRFARGGKTATARVRFRKMFNAPVVSLNLPSFLSPLSFKPVPSQTDSNAFVWDQFTETKGVTQVKLSIPADLVPQVSLAVGTTVTDDFGTIGVERAKGAP